MLVGQIMSQKIVTISPDKRVGQALKMMQKHQIRHLPVLAKDRMVGWITSRDLREVLLASMLEEIKVGDVMVQAPLSVTPDTEVEEAARLIKDAGGKIINVALGPIKGDKRPYYFRLNKINLEPIVNTLKQQG